MGWITYLYRCRECAFEEVEMVDRAEIPEVLTCPQCTDGLRDRIVGTVAIMNTALPDGNRRFQGLREQNALRRDHRKAVRNHDYKEAKRVATEANKIKGRV